MRVSASAGVDNGTTIKVDLHRGSPIPMHYVWLDGTVVQLAFHDLADLLRLRDAIDAAVQPGMVRLDPDQPDDVQALLDALLEQGVEPSTQQQVQLALRSLAASHPPAAGTAG